MIEEYTVTELERTWEQYWRARRNFLAACRKYCEKHDTEEMQLLPPELKKVGE